MKKRIYPIILLISVMFLFLAGCEGTKYTGITMDQFTKTVSEKGYIMADEDYLSALKTQYPLIKDVSLFSTTEDYDESSWGLELVVCEDVAGAKEMYTTFVNNIKGLYGDTEGVEIKEKTIDGSNYEASVITLTVEEEGKTYITYAYMGRVDNTILAGSTLSSDRTAMNAFIQEAGYPLP